MKATIEIPDDLYRRVKARSSLEGLTVKEATVRLYRAWLERGAAAPAPGPRRRQLDAWFREADRATKAAPRRRVTARDELAAARGRLENR